ncbi:MAG: hypothetical protein ABW133_22630 [Polyangiaceae bacterium]
MSHWKLAGVIGSAAVLAAGCGSSPSNGGTSPDAAVRADAGNDIGSLDAPWSDATTTDGSMLDASSDATLSDVNPNRDASGDRVEGGTSSDAPRNDVVSDADAGMTTADARGDGSTSIDAPASDVADVLSGDARDAGAPDATMRCNGYAELCDRRFDEVVFPTTHNAMSNSDDGWIAPNQQHGIKRQLDDGIRGMLIDTYSNMGTVYLCHSSCLLGSRPLADALGDMKTFLQQNPNEVLTLVIENHATAAETETVFAATGFVDLMYVHPSGAAWPTLRAMIESGKRVVAGSETDNPPPAWYHNFYSLAWDTPYSFKSTSEFSCQQNRGTKANALFLLNHWLENPLPDENLSRTANARDVLLGRARQCQMESGKLPNFVAVSHYAVGDLFGVVRELNGL